MHSDVGAELQRLLQEWRGEGVVDYDARAGRSRRGTDRRQVGDVEQRVRWRLEPEHVGDGRTFGPALVVGGETLYLPAPSLLTVRRDARDPLVTIVAQHQVSAGR